jgi:SAM-dependent methyltransferase
MFGAANDATSCARAQARLYSNRHAVMTPQTRDRLLALNRRFYATHSDDFDRTRQRPWRGCERALAHVTVARPNVLDIGCGNGRLIALLRARYPDGFAYTGVDFSAALLAMARARGDDLRFIEADFVANDPERALPAGEYDLVALLGVLHHVPGEDARRALLAAAARRLAPGGVLALTLWRLDADARFARMRVPAADYPALGHELAVTCADFDPGDHLVYWGAAKVAVRYCHFTSGAELARLLAAAGLTCIDRFSADGAGDRMNDYVVLQRV